MTRDEAKALLPIITAYANGAVVQLHCGADCWRDAQNPDFGLAVGQYRIKPAPQYRPWKCYEAPLGKEVVRADGSRMTLHTAYNNTINGYEYATMLRDWKMADGTPCGVEVTT